MWIEERENIIRQKEKKNTDKTEGKITHIDVPQEKPLKK